MFDPQQYRKMSGLPHLDKKHWQAFVMAAWARQEVMDFEGYLSMDGLPHYWSAVDFRPAWPACPKKNEWCPFAIFELVTVAPGGGRAYSIGDVIAYELQLNYSAECYWKDHVLLRTSERRLAAEVGREAFQTALLDTDPEKILHAVSVAAFCRGIEAESTFQRFPYK